jgi:glutamine amidotransferase
MAENESVCIIDYGLGNVSSVLNALNLLGIKPIVSADPEKIKKATYLILIGVGSFGDGMKNLEERNLVNLIRDEVLNKKKKILGICLGMQLFAEKGYEHGEWEGLGLISGSVVKIDNLNSKLRLPHVGWNNTKIIRESKLTEGFKEDPIFYFVHSYHFVPEDPKVIVGVSQYGHDIVALIENGNIFGAQFHPEKSHKDGLNILKNFLNI